MSVFFNVLNEKDYKDRLYDFLERKYSDILMEEFIGTFKKSCNEGISVPTHHNWDNFLVGMGMKLSPFMTHEKDSISIKNPAPHTGFISMTVEMAERIIVLGGLP